MLRKLPPTPCGWPVPLDSAAHHLNNNYSKFNTAAPASQHNVGPGSTVPNVLVLATLFRPLVLLRSSFLFSLQTPLHLPRSPQASSPRPSRQVSCHFIIKFFSFLFRYPQNKWYHPFFWILERVGSLLSCRTAACTFAFHPVSF